MRATITVCGVGQRKTGVSTKTNKPYDFQAVSFTYPDQYTTGEAAATALINGPDIDSIGGQIMIGMQYDVVYHTFGGKVIIDALLA